MFSVQGVDVWRHRGPGVFSRGTSVAPFGGLGNRDHTYPRVRCAHPGLLSVAPSGLRSAALRATTEHPDPSMSPNEARAAVRAPSTCAGRSFARSSPTCGRSGRTFDHDGFTTENTEDTEVSQRKTRNSFAAADGAPGYLREQGLNFGHASREGSNAP